MMPPRRCGPCRAIAPFLEQLAHEYADTCLFVAVDCEASVANRSLATEAAVRCARCRGQHQAGCSCPISRPPLTQLCPRPHLPCARSAFPTFHFYVNRQRVAETRGANREGLRTEIRKHAPGLAQAAVEDGGMTARLVAALQTVKANASFDEFCAAARTLLTFVSNVIAHPGEPPVFLPLSPIQGVYSCPQHRFLMFGHNRTCIHRYGCWESLYNTFTFGYGCRRGAEKHFISKKVSFYTN